MAELSSEDKAKYIKIRDNYQKTKKEILNMLQDKPESKFHPVNTAGYSDAIVRLTYNQHVNVAFEQTNETEGLIQAVNVIKRQIHTNIESILIKNQPRIPGAEEVCIPCDMKSVFFMGRLPQGGSGPDSHYECALCGRNNISDYFRYDSKKG
jgi:hypothetical protein